jgi:hypothetical protein
MASPLYKIFYRISAINESLTTKIATKLNRDNPVVTGSIKESIYTISGLTPVLTPDDRGTIQLWTLSGNSIPTDGIDAGKSITLMIDDGDGYTITWPLITWVGGTPPTLDTTKYTVVELWKVGVVLYGAFVGYA